MSFTSFLKKLGLDALKVAQGASEAIPLLRPFSALIPQIGPQVAAVEGIVQDKLQTVFDMVQQVEQTSAIITSGAPGNGSAKAQAVAVNLPAVLADIELLGGHKLTDKIKDQAKFNVDCQRLAGVVADILNDCGD